MSVLSLGLALGVNTTVFGILDAVVHPPVPVKHPDRLFNVWAFGDRATSWEKYLAVRDRTHFYDGIALTSFTLARVAISDSVEIPYVTQVSRNYFSLLGMRADIGRLFANAPWPADRDAAVIDYGLWSRALAMRPIEGMRLMIGEESYRVVGVLPPGAGSGYGGSIYVLLPPAAEQNGVGLSYVGGVVRLKRGFGREEASAELAQVAARLNQQYGVGNTPIGYTLRAFAETDWQFGQIHFAIGGAAAAILLIACANLANLMLARGTVKRRELAVRLALGSGRRALITQVVSESGLLALGGALVGVVLAVWGIQVLAHQMPGRVPGVGLSVPHLSWRVFALAALATGVTVLLVGVLPAIRISDVDVTEPLKDSAAATTGKVRYRFSSLVVAQVATALVLVTAATLLTKAAQRLSNYQFGYDPEGLLTMSLVLGTRLANPDSAARAGAAVIDRVRATPGARAVASMFTVLPEHYTVLSDAYDGALGFLNADGATVVSHNFLQTLGIPVLRGRDFLPGDEVAGAAIVSEDAVRLLWPTENVVGRSVKLGDSDSRAAWLRVVGVAARASLGFKSDPDLPDRFGIYVMSARYTPRVLRLAIRVTGGEGAMALALRRQIQGALPVGVGGAWVTPWLLDVRGALASRRFLVAVFAAFSGFALLLAAIGLYGVLSYTVSQRIREFGIRIALGAADRDVFSLVLYDAAVMILAGIGSGAFLAMAAAPILKSWLYSVNPTDVVALVIAEAVLFAAGFAACLQPALRAMRASPIEILRAI